MLEIERKEAIRELNEIYNELNVIDELLEEKQRIFLSTVDAINTAITVEEIIERKNEGSIKLASLPTKDDFSYVKYEAVKLVKSYTASVSIDDEELLSKLLCIMDEINQATTKEEVAELLRKALIIANRELVKKNPDILNEEIKKR